MSKVVKIQQNRPLSIITFVCAIIAALTLVVVAVSDVLTSGVSIVSNLLTRVFLGNDISFLNILSSVESLIVTLIFALVMVAAAVLLLVNRSGSLSFIPMGLLTYGALVTPISCLCSLLLGVFSPFVPSVVLNFVSFVSLILVQIIGALLALVFAVIVFVLAATLFRKLRPIPMALISLILGVNLVVNIPLAIITIIGYIPNMSFVFSGDLPGIYLINLLISSLLLVVGIVLKFMLFTASIFAVLAVIPYKKKVPVEDGAESDGVIEAVAEEVVAEGVATEDVAADAPAEPAAE